MTFINETRNLWAIRSSYDRYPGEVPEVQSQIGRVIGWVCKAATPPGELAIATPLVGEVRFFGNVVVTEGHTSEWCNEQFQSESEDENGQKVKVVSTVRVLVVEGDYLLAQSVADTFAENLRKAPA